MCYIKTEDNIYAFIIEIINKIPYMSEFVKNKENNEDIDTKCCILTNKDFLIHEFTTNSLEQLGLRYRYMKSSNSIIPYIKQLNDDYKNMINDYNSKNSNTCINNNNNLLESEESSISEFKIDSNNNISPEIKRKIKDDLIKTKYNKNAKLHGE